MDSTELTPLPRGRHKLRRSEVRDSQRARLIRAMLECVAEKGYTATTAADVVARAQVSRNAFFELFGDKQACYLKACDEANVQLLGQMYEASQESAWLDAVRSGMAAYLRWWRERPGYASGYLVELPSAGRAAMEQRDRVQAEWVAMFEALAARAREEQPKLPELAPLTARMLVASVTELVGEEVRAGRLDRIEELEDALVFQVVKALADDATARRALRRGRRGPAAA
jgi:AcrR family transcriptional regulator